MTGQGPPRPSNSGIPACGIDTADIALRVSRSRQAQGLPVRVTDPTALARVAALLLLELEHDEAEHQVAAMGALGALGSELSASKS